jgi:hypothetical protein
LILYPRSKSFKPYKLKDTPTLQATKGITLKQYNHIDLSKPFTKIDEMDLSFYKTHHVRSLGKIETLKHSVYILILVLNYNSGVKEIKEEL